MTSCALQQVTDCDACGSQPVLGDMSACDHFTQNAWRPDLCSTCQRAKSEHAGIQGPRSWRRKSEPNPNNAITGVRISALASKFQAADARNGHTREAEIDRKTGPSSAATAKPKSASSASVATAKTSALPSSNKISSQSSALSSSSESSSKGGSSATSSSAAVKSNRTRHPGKEPTKKVTITQPSFKQLTASSFVKIQHTDTSMESQPSKQQQPRGKQKRRVSIPDREPDIIGTDGGLDNLVPEEEVVSGGDSEQICLSLTDEEKQFALLALGNTLWNSDTRNLQVGADISRRTCREFEDLSVDELWSQNRFKSLVSCDPVRKKKDFGTFPQVNTSKHSKAAVGSLSFSSQGKKASGGAPEGNSRSLSQASTDGDVMEDESATTSSEDLAPQGVIVSKDSRGKGSGSGHEVKEEDQANCSKGGSKAGIGSAFSSDPKESVDLFAATDSLDKSHNGLEHVVGKKALKTSENNAGVAKVDNCDPTCDASVATSPLSVAVKNQDSSEVNQKQVVTTSLADVAQDERVSASFADSTEEEEFQAVALLNEVLEVYGEMNESSTDDFTSAEEKKGKKSSDFEARMASVAATLDLTKQQQRGKRQAPRPSVSPPPEPNLSEGVSPKKVVNQPDPVFKMVTVGKSIVSLPPQQDMPPKNTKPALVSYGFDEFGALPDSSDIANSRGTNGDGKGKKGITSFFRNILRRGKDSSESFDLANPDVQLSVRMDRKVSTDTVESVDLPDEDSSSSSSVDQKVGPKFSPQAKFLIMPSTSPAHALNGTLSDGAGDTDGEGAFQPEADTAATSTLSSVAMVAGPLVKSSPPAQRRNSKGLASPKMMPRKPPVTSIPDMPSSVRPSVTSVSDVPSAASSSVTEDRSSSATSAVTKELPDKESVAAPSVVRRRPKSPKRVAPPVPPTRTSTGAGNNKVPWNLSAFFFVHYIFSGVSGGGTLPRSELRESTRRSLPEPPSPPGERKDKSSGSPVGSRSPPVSPIKETLHSLPSSPSSPALSSFDFTNSQWSGGSTTMIDDELPKFSEKIELPTVATQSRKGILGKLGGNRKTKAPQPPSVKRAKSITQSSTLPRGDKKNKKINVADISGPVLVTDVTNAQVLENRRNTISLGDEPAFVSCNSSASVDKSGLDEFDFPFLSPLGSLENLYESILPKPEGNQPNFYDPPTSPKVVCPNVTSDGYLEPVPPLSVTAAASSSLSLLGTTATNVSSSSSTSSASSMTTNASVIKSPLVKSKATSSTTERPKDAHANYKDSGTFPSHSSGISSTVGSSGLGPTFVEPEMTEQRRLLLASQPIYEEIPNGDNEDVEDYKDANVVTRKDVDGLAWGSKADLFSRGTNDTSSLKRVILPEVSKNQIAQSWLQQQSQFVGTTSPLPASLLSGTPSSLSSSTTSVGAASSSPSHTLPRKNSASSSVPVSSAFSVTLSHTLPRQNSPSSSLTMTSSHTLPRQNSVSSSTPVSSSLSMTSSQIMSSSLMTASLTSSMLPPPPPPPALPPSASRSISKETVSSESDTQSLCSNDAHSNSSTWSRPRPTPRQKPKRPETGGCDQYISMNKPNAQVSLSEETLRDVFSKLTSITFHALQDIYAQFEKVLSVDRLEVPNSKMLKWADFDIYGQPLHASGRCVVYNAKLKANGCPCQLLILHSRPATEMCMSTHPSLLTPSAVFADTIPFSYLTPDFIKTSQLLQNSVYDSSQARCFIAVGAFDIVESLDSHLTLLRETLAQDLNSYLSVILTATLQLLSAMSYCLDQGFSVTETDYDDVFLITRSDLRGKVVAFLPRQRSLDVPQGEAICNFLDRLLVGNMPDEGDNDDDSDVGNDDEDDVEKIISSPRKVVSKLRSMLGHKKVECLGQVRTTVEYLLWGPALSELPLSPTRAESKPATRSPAGGASKVNTRSPASKEQEFYVWLEKERLLTVAKLARSVSGLGAGLSLEEFYTLKFLLKTSPGCLAESLRRLSR
ncbi:unnamed protein product [Candidula unifasciata]|uniref:Uncharacterized protein n=1 Tax=Candidula unifasciata TaxID=100452 RepID=A0A8S3ZPB6_9EUPU|nr:unnamed protein product [Candidula unifasciata]